jgi:hypothetical protein
MNRVILFRFAGGDLSSGEFRSDQEHRAAAVMAWYRQCREGTVGARFLAASEESITVLNGQHGPHGAPPGVPLCRLHYEVIARYDDDEAGEIIVLARCVDPDPATIPKPHVALESSAVVP